jgi:outer membrane protein assembly factor BamA
VVDSVIIVGNRITENFVILNELTFGEGDTVTNEDLFFNRERIFSLGLFNKVTIENTKEDFRNIIIIEVEESWYIFPLPFVEIKERDYKKLSYGVYLVYKNFRGRNETIFGTISFGYNPSFGITYINPNLTDEGDYFLRFSSSFSKNKNRSIKAESDYGSEFNYKQIFTALLLGKRINPFNKLFLTFSFNYLELEKLVPNYTVGNEKIDRYPQLGLGYEFDNRDLLQFPRKGNYFYLNSSFNGLGVNKVNHQSMKIDYRHYSELLNNLYLKFRTSSRLTFGDNVPQYDYSLIGTEEKIRGNFFKRIEDRNLLAINTELYYPLINEMQLDFSFIPIIPKQLLSYRVALYFQTFADYGSVFKDFYKSTSSLSGYGIGISLLVLPYNVIRFELGFNEKSQKEFIIDFGTSF